MGEKCSPSFTINTIDFSSPSYRPTDDICQCNLPAYNLMAGCFWCQDPAASAWPSLTEWQSSCRNTTFVYGIPSELETITYPYWATLQPDGTTWVANDAFVVAQIVSSTSSSRRSYYTSSEPYYYSGYRENLYVVPILLITAISLLIVVGLAWCVVLCIFWHRQRDRARFYNQVATYHRFGPPVGSQTVPLMRNQEYNPMSPQFPSQQNTGAAAYRTSMYPIAEADQSRAISFAAPNGGLLRTVDAHPGVAEEGNIASTSHRAHESPIHSPLVPISPLPGTITVQEDVKGKGRATEGGGYAL